jgi:hypothetical protein
MMRRFPPGERKINYTHIINGRNVFVKRNGSRERREKFLAQLPGGWGVWGKVVERREIRKKWDIGGKWWHFSLWYDLENWQNPARWTVAPLLLASVGTMFPGEHEKHTTHVTTVLLIVSLC